MRNIILWVFAGLSVTLASVVQAQSAEKIVIDGSTGVTPLVAALAKALRDGKIDMAMASHGLKVDDIKRQGMAVHEIAKVAVLFGVNASVSATDLTDTLTRDSFLVTQETPSPAVAKFMEFVWSNAGKKVIAANGAMAAK
ncbi:MAG TPA: hypothetical protein VK642_09560 [Burkholderiales bacterium]|nr:hypothetical protein [Burkholderiales bacterium]